MTDEVLQGGCQCGAVRYSITGEPMLAAICHCTMCRRAHAAPAVAWAMFDESQVAFDKGQPHPYASSPDARRGFCRDCGTQISFTASFLPGLIDISLGSLDDPEAIRPTLHYWDNEHLSWVDFADGLPRHPEFPPME
ncbi:GFA family protein [Luteimonas sp. SX5]|uniref:GFA family protein n=1 Tax=Luteimonas galliterrae TaxID=2940486 RepID=A0ABT0MEZ0_9GAMM|nr:GFA family protein [Luteimonas galliterrae]MCL1633233.1 GFA family protein [Luteimonas galliterrae]